MASGPSRGHAPSDSVTAILMLEDPHGWMFTAPPWRTKAFCNWNRERAAAQKQDRDESTAGGER